MGQQLPTWADCEAACDDLSATALETFIYNYEPGDNDKEWRNRLAGVLTAAKRELAEKVLTVIKDVKTGPTSRTGSQAQIYEWSEGARAVECAVSRLFTELGVAVEKEG